MALQATVPPTDSGEFHRSELLRRLAKSPSRSGDGRPGRRRPREILAWDPAEFLGVSPYVMMGICGQVGVVLGLLVFSTFQLASRAASSTAEKPVAIQAQSVGEAGEAPAGFVAVADLSPPAQVVDDYYYFLRQGLFDDAWALTDDAFRGDNYPAGFAGYEEAWAGSEAIEVLSLDLTWQGPEEAHLVGEIVQGVSGQRWRNSYVLRFDDAQSTWTIHAIAPTW